MNEQAEKSGVAIVDVLKLVLAAAALLGGIVAYYWFKNEPQVVRVLMVLGGVGTLAATVFGNSGWFRALG